MSRFLLLAALSLAVPVACGREPYQESTTQKAAATALADQQAEAMLRQANALIQQKKAAQAETVLMQVIRMKPRLSEQMRKRVGPAIAALGTVAPSRAVELGKQWGE